MDTPRAVTSSQIRDQKQSGTPIVAVTAYDFLTARLVDEIADVVLVGDSLGMVIQGKEDTLSVTVDEVIYHTRAVKRALRRAHLVADMPFMSYQVSDAKAVRNAGRLVSEGGAAAVKIEGGVRVASAVEKITAAGIPVMGHIGLTPQSVLAFGGYKVQGKTPSSRESILQDALALEDSGVYSMVLEGVPSELAKEITARVKIPTIGIGAGMDCDGQILVIQDLLGMNPSFKPRFVKHFANLSEVIQKALQTYAQEVKGRAFPGPEHSFSVPAQEDSKR